MLELAGAAEFRLRNYLPAEAMLAKALKLAEAADAKRAAGEPRHCAPVSFFGISSPMLMRLVMQPLHL